MTDYEVRIINQRSEIERLINEIYLTIVNHPEMTINDRSLLHQAIDYLNDARVASQAISDALERRNSNT